MLDKSCFPMEGHIWYLFSRVKILHVFFFRAYSIFNYFEIAKISTYSQKVVRIRLMVQCRQVKRLVILTEIIGLTDIPGQIAVDILCCGVDNKSELIKPSLSKHISHMWDVCHIQP